MAEYRLNKWQRGLSVFAREYAERNGLEEEAVTITDWNRGWLGRVGKAVDKFCEKEEESHRVTGKSRQVFKEDYNAA